jgi:hypothetical protein
MKIRFKTQVKTGEETLPAGRVHDMPDKIARKYIERGLAVAIGEGEKADVVHKPKGEAGKKPPAKPPKGGAPKEGTAGKEGTAEQEGAPPEGEEVS